MRKLRGWDLTALLNAAHPQAPLAERNLWLVRLVDWLRRAPLKDVRAAAAKEAAKEAAKDVAKEASREAAPADNTHRFRCGACATCSPCWSAIRSMRRPSPA